MKTDCKYLLFASSSGHCSLDCPYCIITPGNRKNQPSLDYADFRFLLNSLGGKTLIWLSGRGDFFEGYRPRDRLLNRLLEEDVELILDISGVSINELGELPDELLAKIKSVNITLHYQQLKKHGLLSKWRENTLCVINRKDECLFLGTVVSPLVRDYWHDALLFYQDEIFAKTSHKIHLVHDEMNLLHEKNKMDLEDLICQFSHIIHSEIRTDHSAPFKNSVGVLCPAGLTSFRLWNDGAIQGCPYVHELRNLGNAKTRLFNPTDRRVLCTLARYCDCSTINSCGRMISIERDEEMTEYAQSKSYIQPVTPLAARNKGLSDDNEGLHRRSIVKLFSKYSEDEIRGFIEEYRPHVESREESIEHMHALLSSGTPFSLVRVSDSDSLLLLFGNKEFEPYRDFMRMKLYFSGLKVYRRIDALRLREIIEKSPLVAVQYPNTVSNFSFWGGCYLFFKQSGLLDKRRWSEFHAIYRSIASGELSQYLVGKRVVLVGAKVDVFYHYFCRNKHWNKAFPFLRFDEIEIVDRIITPDLPECGFDYRELVEAQVRKSYSKKPDFFLCTAGLLDRFLAYQVYEEIGATGLSLGLALEAMMGFPGRERPLMNIFRGYRHPEYEFHLDAYDRIDVITKNPQ